MAQIRDIVPVFIDDVGAQCAYQCGGCMVPAVLLSNRLSRFDMCSILEYYSDAARSQVIASRGSK